MGYAFQLLSRRSNIYFRETTRTNREQVQHADHDIHVTVSDGKLEFRYKAQSIPHVQLMLAHLD